MYKVNTEIAIIKIYNSLEAWLKAVIRIEVCQVANISRATFYNKINGKSGLLLSEFEILKNTMEKHKIECNG